MTPELARKLERVRRLLEDRSSSALILRKQTNLAWLLCGAEAFVARTTDMGNLTAVVTHDSCHALLNNVEAVRMEAEELSGLDVTVQAFPWHSDRTGALLSDLAAGPAIADSPAPGATVDDLAVCALQTPLTDEEIVRYRALGADCGAALGDAMRAVRPGLPEHEIAGLVAGEALARGITPAVLLVAADERAFRYRHPLPTSKMVRNYVLCAMVGRRRGLHCSLTRSVYLGGAVPAELIARQTAVQGVEAALLEATRPGATAGDAFEAARAAYAAAGVPEEWELHHQGGATGYQPRLWRAMPGGTEPILDCQAFAWNPTIAGTKSEDTVLCTEEGIEVLSASPDWPTASVTVGGRTLGRPGILVL